MLKCASFFAGVGGIDIAFEKTKKFKVVYANEIDPSPVKTYELNFNIKVDNRDINTVKQNEIPDFDVMIAGFPCQAFSIAGYREGFNDKKGRGILFFQLVRIISAKKPKVVFLENVKNLENHDGGKTLETILGELAKEKYYVKYKVLNAMNYGNVPQNRERIYIVGFKNKQSYEKFEFPEKVKLTKRITDIIDFNSKFDNKYYYKKNKYRGDIYDKLCEAMKNDDKAVYQWRRHYVRKNKSGVVPTLTANQGEGGHNVCIVKTKFGIRKMIPRECFNAQGFDKEFLLPKDSPDSKLYKQAGNSVCVTVVNRIAKNIARACKNIK